MSTLLKLISSSKSFGGFQKVYSHYSKELSCNMNFGIYLPPNINTNNCVPVLYWLSGLTCTEENFIKKAGGQRFASKHGIAIVCPDTSPRNTGIFGEDDSSDFGTGAGFYVDATEEPWNKNYRMYSYITSELIELINENFPVLKNKQSVSGHSMGGHGALICALKNPGLYCSVSAFAPISNPMKSSLGQKAFSGYLGENIECWKKYDATELVKNYKDKIEIWLDQGTDDEYLTNQHLLPENFLSAASENTNVNVIYKLRDGYDHSHYYVSSFIDEHIEYHSNYLKC